MMPSAAPSSQCGSGVKSKRRRACPRCARRTFADSSGADRHVGMRQVRHLEQPALELRLGGGDGAAPPPRCGRRRARCTAIACSRSAGSFMSRIAFDAVVRSARSVSTACSASRRTRRPRAARRPRDAATPDLRQLGLHALGLVRGSAGCRACATLPSRRRRARARRPAARRRSGRRSRRSARRGRASPCRRRNWRATRPSLRLLADVDRLERRAEPVAAPAPHLDEHEHRRRRGPPGRSRRRGSGSSGPRSCTGASRRNASATASPRRPAPAARPPGGTLPAVACVARRCTLTAEGMALAEGMRSRVRCGPFCAERSGRRVCESTRTVGYATPAWPSRATEVRRVAALARLRLEPRRGDAPRPPTSTTSSTRSRAPGARHDAASRRRRTSSRSATPLRDDAVTNPPAGDALLANAPARDGRSSASRRSSNERRSHDLGRPRGRRRASGAARCPPSS